jgi:hypothetical protein
MPAVLQAFFLLHQGEEFVLALPVVLLAGAFVLMSWGSKSDKGDAEDPGEPLTEEHIA